MVVIPEQVAVGAAYEAFAEDGSLVDEKLAGRVATAMKLLVRTSSRLKENE
jgi:hypothetical protein